MEARVESLDVYSVKGMRGDRRNVLNIDPKAGVRGDRQFAFHRKPDILKTDGRGNPVWLPKGQFYVGMNAPEMVALDALPIDTSMREAGRVLGTMIPSRAVVNTRQKFNMTDTRGASVSVLNLATVKAVEERFGVTIDPRRFRMNVGVSGWKPFAEYELVDIYPGTRQLRIGAADFRVDDACERCKAIEANPETGAYDMALREMLEQVMTERGYKSPHRQTPCVMGILLVPVGRAKAIRTGNRVFI